MIKEALGLLGESGKDRVTGFKGTVSSVCFDLYGCVQLAITPPVGKDGMTKEGHWFDIGRVEIAKGKRVMPVPTFGGATVAEFQKGPAEKPRKDI